MSNRLVAHWSRLTVISVLLLPLAGLFTLAVRLRRFAYLRGWKASVAVGVPVIVVGNITAGGSGKTPLVIWLVNWLREQGWHPGVVSRGYRGDAQVCMEVQADSSPAQVGDEPLLIHFKTQSPVVVGRDRVAAARALLQAHPDIDILISDDGLQHYRLQRQLELAVVDTHTGLGNGLPLPAGPLREPASRLTSVDAVVRVVRSTAPVDRVAGPFYQALYTFGLAYALTAPGHKIALDAMSRGPWRAITGIGNPQAFFAMLTQLGWAFEPQVFADHHAFQLGDIPVDKPVVMTEKDAVKCLGFAQSDWWALELDVQPEPAMIMFLRTKMESFSQKGRVCQTE